MICSEENPLTSSEPSPINHPPRRLGGKPIARTMGTETAAAVARLVAAGGRPPKLVAVLVGDDPASRTYVASKARACETSGLIGETLALPADLTTDALLGHIERLNADDTVDGILVQLPLPAQIAERKILDAVAPEKDVDGFHPVNVGRLWLGEPALTPATPTGIIALLRHYEIPLAGRHAVVVGRSAIVGKPMAGLLLREHCTVTVCHSRTRDLPAVCRQAEILVVAIGRAGFIGPAHVAEGAVVIDVGMNRITDSEEMARLFPDDAGRRRRFEERGYALTGDVDYHRAAPRASAITPVPGGVGLLTVAQVIANTLIASQRRQGLTATAAP